MNRLRAAAYAFVLLASLIAAADAKAADYPAGPVHVVRPIYPTDSERNGFALCLGMLIGAFGVGTPTNA